MNDKDSLARSHAIRKEKTLDDLIFRVKQIVIRDTINHPVFIGQIYDDIESDILIKQFLSEKIEKFEKKIKESNYPDDVDLDIPLEMYFNNGDEFFDIGMDDWKQFKESLGVE